MVHPISSSLTQLLPALALLVLMAGAAPANAQQEIQKTAVYKREFFEYTGAARQDPFRSAVRGGEVGVRMDDLSLRGIVHHSDPSRSVAFVVMGGGDRRIQARVGESVGTVRFLAIHPDRVEVAVEEMGVSRREMLRIQRPAPAGES